MATTPTNNAVPSESPRDLKFNAGKIDEFVNQMAPNFKYTDRFGNEHLTIAGIENLARQIIGTLGWVPFGTFEDGATLTDTTQTLKYDADGNYYRWDGDFPKAVPVGSTPDSAGGVAQGAWVNVSDLTLRTALASSDVGGGGSLVALEYGGTVQDVIDDDIGYSKTTEQIINNLSENKIARFFDGIATPAPGLSVPSRASLSGTLGRSSLSKSGNATITLSNIDPNALPATVDTVVYVNPAWLSESIFPREATLDGFTINGDSASENECGLFILQGRRYAIKNTEIFNAKYSLRFQDIWRSTIDSVTAHGVIQQERGTSTTYINCSATGHNDVLGAFRMEHTMYMNMISCATDAAKNGGYYFNDVTGSVSGCGGEFATISLSGVHGLFMNFASGCKMTFNGCFYAARGTDTAPLIHVAGDNNRLIYNSFNCSNAQNYSGADIRISGNGNTVVFNQCVFGMGRTLPRVHIEFGSTSIVIVNTADGNQHIYYASASESVLLARHEQMFLSGTLSPIIRAGATQFTTTTAECDYDKNAGVMTVQMRLKVSSLNGASGSVNVTGLPGTLRKNTVINVGYFAGCRAGISSLYASVDTQSEQINFFYGNNGSVSPLTVADITASFDIILSYTQIAFNSKYHLQ
ncbi:hypothetical protein [Candidatus Symbiopectobacterium sp. NZEC135]|uniref:tail fiber/spike domain-containing protein n=1 Tax=Candidatus Symbiopectobacterium sp. NZEC135 TaxID=2820471 RepID=UPI002225EDD4|nr:hypothetical protein [Candidatus Symbiopectobacterium sp. NZEC135]MCW2477772.1 hypothetical protein [Candidatus Symbiopectobacterium sp. NZEC135]